jgi:hypothetical protein
MTAFLPLPRPHSFATFDHLALLSQVIEKQENKAKDLCEKLSAAWDPYGVSANQIRLLEAKAISTPDELEQQREVYESGPKMMEDFLHWIQVQFGVPEPEGGNVGSDDVSHPLPVLPCRWFLEIQCFSNH